MAHNEEKIQNAVIVQPQQGLANRLRVLASAVITARYAGRKLYLDWVTDEKCGASWDELFENEIPLFGGALPWDARIYRNEPQNFSHPGSGDLVDDTENVVVVQTYFSFKPKKMSMTEFIRLKSEFYRGLVPVAPVRERLEEITRKHFSGRWVVGVHIRRSDLVMVGDPALYVSPTYMFIERMRRLVTSRADVAFFLSTDDKHDEERIIAEFPGKVFTHPKTGVERNTRQGIRDALVDLLCLSKTRLIIRSAGTSFSREAAILGGVPRETIKRSLWPYTRFGFWKEGLKRRVTIAMRRFARKAVKYGRSKRRPYSK